MTEAENLGTYPLVAIPVESLSPHPDNPRGNDLGDLTDMVASIQAQGVVQPLVVVPIEGEKDRYFIVAGHRRHAAAVKVGLASLPSVVRHDMPESQQVEVMLVENVQRADLSPLQQAKGLKRLIDLGLSQRDVAARTGIAQGTVSKRLSLLALGEEIASKVDSGGIGIHDAEVLAKVAREKGEAGASVIKAAQRFIERGQDATKAVQQAEAELRTAAKIKGLRDRMKKADVAEVQSGDVKPSWEGIQEKDLPGHAGHAVFVTTYQGDGKFYCKTPRVHMPADEKEKAKAEKAKESAAKAAAAEAAEKARGHRYAILRALSSGDQASLVGFVAWASLLASSLPAGYPSAAFMGDWLGLPTDTTEQKGKETVHTWSFAAISKWQVEKANSEKKVEAIRAAALYLAGRFAYALDHSETWAPYAGLREVCAKMIEAGWEPTPDDKRRMPTKAEK